MAPPLCGRRARGKRRVRPAGTGRGSRRGGRKSGRCGTGSYARYPHYPQADSAWSKSDSMTASGCGRDDLPATEESLPSHSPGGRLVERLRTGSLERKRTAGRLTKPRRWRTMAGLPFSGCESGRLRKAPIRNRHAFGFAGTGAGPTVFGPAERPGGTPDLRIQDQPGRKRCLRAGALPPAQKGLRFRRGRAGPGFGPGAANKVWTQGFGS